MNQPDKSANPTEESASNTSNESNEGQPSEDFAGYRSLEEMRTAVYESRKHGKALAEQNAQLAGYVNRLLAAHTSAAESKSEADELDSLGIPVEALERLIDKRAEAKFEAKMGPVQRTTEAINSVRGSHPSFAKNESDFNKWLGANPDVLATFNQAVAESPRSAEILIRGIYADYEATRRSAPSPEPKKVDTGGKLPNTRGSGSARTPEAKNQLDRETAKELLKDARRTGDPVPMLRAILGDRPVHRDLVRNKG